MRIISGNLRGLKLNSPKNMDVRPTTDRVKESLFNILAPKIYGSNVLDLFAGSGALGVESLSRGAKKAYFVDLSKESISIIKSNIEKCKLMDKSEVIRSDFSLAVKKISERKIKMDLIFLDPPYHEGYFEKCLNLLSESDILSNEGVIVVEHDTKDKLKEQYGKLNMYREKKYAKTTISFFSLKNDI